MVIVHSSVSNAQLGSTVVGASSGGEIPSNGTPEKSRHNGSRQQASTINASFPNSQLAVGSVSASINSVGSSEHLPKVSAIRGNLAAVETAPQRVAGSGVLEGIMKRVAPRVVTVPTLDVGTSGGGAPEVQQQQQQGLHNSALRAPLVVNDRPESQKQNMQVAVVRSGAVVPRFKPAVPPYGTGVVVDPFILQRDLLVGHQQETVVNSCISTSTEDSRLTGDTASGPLSSMRLATAGARSVKPPVQRGFPNPRSAAASRVTQIAIQPPKGVGNNCTTSPSSTASSTGTDNSNSGETSNPENQTTKSGGSAALAQNSHRIQQRIEAVKHLQLANPVAEEEILLEKQLSKSGGIWGSHPMSASSGSRLVYPTVHNGNAGSWNRRSAANSASASGPIKTKLNSDDTKKLMPPITNSESNDFADVDIAHAEDPSALVGTVESPRLPIHRSETQQCVQEDISFESGANIYAVGAAKELPASSIVGTSGTLKANRTATVIVRSPPDHPTILRPVLPLSHDEDDVGTDGASPRNDDDQMSVVEAFGICNTTTERSAKQLLRKAMKLFKRRKQRRSTALNNTSDEVTGGKDDCSLSIISDTTADNVDVSFVTAADNVIFDGMPSFGLLPGRVFVSKRDIMLQLTYSRITHTFPLENISELSVDELLGHVSLAISNPQNNSLGSPQKDPRVIIQCSNAMVLALEISRAQLASRLLKGLGKAGGRVLTFVHFNDVYELQPQKTTGVIGGASRFMTVLNEVRQKSNPLVLFSGDFVAPSRLSTITKGRHMVDMFNAIGVHYGCFGNHDFDFGLKSLKNIVHGQELNGVVVPASNTVWIMSNLTEADGSPAGGAVRAVIFNWQDTTVGIVGLCEDWMATCPGLAPGEIKYTDLFTVGESLAQSLKANGAEVVIALTHSRLATDKWMHLNCPSIDYVFGGHDHFYKHSPKLRLLKSGNDFQYLSEISFNVDKRTATVNCHPITAVV